MRCPRFTRPLSVALFLLAPAVARGDDLCLTTDIWVDAVNGDNTNSGMSPDDPFRTVSHALGQVLSDWYCPIHLAPGIYDEASGESFPWRLPLGMWLVGADRDSVEVRIPADESAMRMEEDWFPSEPNGIVVKGITFTGEPTSQVIGMTWTHGWTGWLEVWDSRTVGVGSVTVWNGNGGGTSAYCDVGLSGNQFVDLSLDLLLGPGSGVLSARLDNNLFLRSSVTLRGDDPAGSPAGDLKLLHNTFVDDERAVRLGELLEPRPVLLRAAMVNNVFAGAGTSIVVERPLSQFALRNNLFAPRVGPLYEDRYWSTRLFTESELNGLDGAADNLVADPGFVDPASDDYHLAAGSPGIDTGSDGRFSTAIRLPTVDFDGDLRPLDGDADGLDEYDIGFDERTAKSKVWRGLDVIGLRPLTPPRNEVLPLDPTEHLYLEELATLELDPDPDILDRDDRPLVFYQVEGMRRLLLVRTTDRRIRLGF